MPLCSTNQTITLSSIQDDVKAIGLISVVPSILDVVCRTTGMGFAAIARVTDDKWIVCSVRDEISFGLQPGSELVLETTICNEIRQHHQPVVIDHVEKDPAFKHHHTPEMYGFQSYISMPIVKKNGSFFGTLCAIDPKPARLNTPETIGMFRLFADLISFHLDAIEKLVTVETNLEEERKTSELREQFIAILGHDLRNPIGAISNSAQLMQRMPLDESMSKLVNIVKNSSFRVLGLIENMLDFARGRLGGGIALKLANHDDIVTVLNQVVNELHAVWPNRVIETSMNILHPVNCDSARIAQLFSNLLSNALSYGKPGTAVLVNAQSTDGKFILSVTNQGTAIPASAMKRLFTAFSRSEEKAGQDGLGLGLYIASEIAKAHSGTIGVQSTPQATTFTLEIPAI